MDTKRHDGTVTAASRLVSEVSKVLAGLAQCKVKARSVEDTLWGRHGCLWGWCSSEDTGVRVKSHKTDGQLA